MAILECKDLCFSYEGKRVLEGVNFSLNAGDYFQTHLFYFANI